MADGRRSVAHWLHYALMGLVALAAFDFNMAETEKQLAFGAGIFIGSGFASLLYLMALRNRTPKAPA